MIMILRLRLYLVDASHIQIQIHTDIVEYNRRNTVILLPSPLLAIKVQQYPLQKDLSHTLILHPPPHPHLFPPPSSRPSLLPPSLIVNLQPIVQQAKKPSNKRSRNGNQYSPRLLFPRQPFCDGSNGRLYRLLCWGRGLLGSGFFISLVLNRLGWVLVGRRGK